MDWESTASMIYFALSLLTLALAGALRIGRTHQKVTVAAFAGLLAIGQLMHDSTVTYPFIRWDMYSTLPKLPHTVHVVRTASGQELRYPFDLVVSTEPRALVWRLQSLVNRCACDRGDKEIDILIGKLALLFSKREGDELVHCFIEGVGLLPIGRVSRLRDDHGARMAQVRIVF